VLPFTPAPPVRKRILLTPTTGPRKGISIIYGTDDQLRDTYKVSELPDFLPQVSFGDHTGPACLVRVQHRFIEYREVITPDGAASEMHPAQV
jgi:hypothetical protein